MSTEIYRSKWTARRVVGCIALVLVAAMVVGDAAGGFLAICVIIVGLGLIVWAEDRARSRAFAADYEATRAARRARYAAEREAAAREAQKAEAPDSAPSSAAEESKRVESSAAEAEQLLFADLVAEAQRKLSVAPREL